MANLSGEAQVHQPEISTNAVALKTPESLLTSGVLSYKVNTMPGDMYIDAVLTRLQKDLEHNQKEFEEAIDQVLKEKIGYISTPNQEWLKSRWLEDRRKRGLPPHYKCPCEQCADWRKKNHDKIADLDW